MHDLLGLTGGRVPRFVRAYSASRETWSDAIRRYASDVRARAFPSVAEEYGMPAAEQARFGELLQAG